MGSPISTRFTPLGAWRAFLRAPLIIKLIGANLLIVLGALAEHYLMGTGSFTARIAAALALSFAVTGVLAWLALRPIAQLEKVADRVSRGDWTTRVPASPIADAQVARLSTTMNRLLDRVQADRARIEYLAGRAVRARDIERENVARELRDSLAQMVAAIAMGLASARRGTADPEVDRQLEATRQLVEDLTDQLQGVAEALYPGTIAEFGLPNALESLARVTARRSGIPISVDASSFRNHWPPAALGALYRTADEALRNVVQHSQARHVQVVLATDDKGATLDVVDDGRGVDVRLRDPLQEGLGLFSARSVLALASGELQISGAPGRGTRVTARVPRLATPLSTWQSTSFA